MYEKLKTELIRQLSDSREQNIRRLLEHEEIGDRKPSIFLRRLQNFAGDTVSDDSLKTGFDLCVFPRSRVRGHVRRPLTNFTRRTVQRSRRTGASPSTLNLGLRRDFSWRFVIAHVTMPIIGAEFLEVYGLIVDLRSKRLIDDITTLSTAGCVVAGRPESVKALSGESTYHTILAEFPGVTRSSGGHRTTKHATCHYIRTTPGPPVSRKSLRLTPDKLSIAKVEFGAMVKDGTMRRSESCW